jgi:hypothetical protein
MEPSDEGRRVVCELKKEWKEVNLNTELVGTSRTQTWGWVSCLGWRVR